MADVTIPAWFDGSTYMQNKLKALQATDSTITYNNMLDTFTEAGYIDEPGYYQHFLDFGKHEGISPNTLFNPDQYMQFKAIQYFTSEAGGSLSETVVRGDMQYYAGQIKQALDDAGLSAFEHYEQFGGKEGINTSNDFDDSNYIDAKVAALAAAGTTATADEVRASIAEAGMTPLQHYLTYKGEGAGEVAKSATFTVPEKEQVATSSSSEGQTFTLTTAAGDVVSGTDADDLVIGTAGVTAANGATYNAGDYIDGKGGTDTLQIAVIGAAEAIATVALENVEVVKVNYTTAGADAGITAAMFPTVKEVWQYDNVAGANDGNYESIAVADGVKVGFGSTGTAATASKVTANDKVDFGQSATSGTILLDGIGSASSITLENGAVTNNALLTTLNVEGTIAGSANTLTLDTAVNAGASGITKLNLALESNTTVTLANADKVTTVDSSASTGNVSVDLSALTTDVFKTALGGDGNDTFTVKLGANSALADTTISTGAGNDVVNLLAADNTLTGVSTVALGAGADTLKLGATGDNFANIKAAGSDDALNATIVKVTATDWTDNTLDLSTLGAGKAAKISTTGQTKIDNEASSLKDALTLAAGEATLGTNCAILFSYGGDSYIYTDAAGDGAGVTAAADGLIQLVGLQNLDSGSVQLNGVATA